MRYNRVVKTWECPQGHRVIDRTEDEEDTSERVIVEIPYEKSKSEETEHKSYRRRVENNLKQRKEWLEAHLVEEADVFVREDGSEFFVLKTLEDGTRKHEVPTKYTRKKCFGYSGNITNWPSKRKPQSGSQ